jgi:hypothetical protein
MADPPGDLPERSGPRSIAESDNVYSGVCQGSPDEVAVIDWYYAVERPGRTVTRGC